MRLNAALVMQRPALMHRLTGLTVEEFTQAHTKFAEVYQRRVIQPRENQAGRQRAAGGGRRGRSQKAPINCSLF